MTMDERPVDVVLFGVGTLGTCLAEALVRQRALNLVLVDGDRVEEHNLAKSALFDRGDVGRLKVAAAAEKLGRIRPEARVAPLPYQLETLRTGIARITRVSVAALDNRLAKFHWNRFNQSGRTPYALIAELEGSGSLAGRLRYFTPAQPESACLECGWSEREYEQLEKLGQPCARPGEKTHSAEPFTPALRLAAETVEQITRLLDGQPGLQPGEEVRLLPEQRRWLSLRTPFRPDCLAQHDAGQELALAGEVGRFRVEDFIETVTRAIGGGWTWLLPQPAPLALAGSLTAAALSAHAGRLMAELWPPGDLLRLVRRDGESVVIGLPLDGLLGWLSSEGLSGRCV